jgi:hypothetical protein
MSMDPFEAEEGAALERLYNEFGPEWAVEHREELDRETITAFTSGRLQSYYVAHPNLAQPARDALTYAQSLASTHPKAALVFATTAVELAIKTVLLQPIVFGLVHTDGMAAFITELTTLHTGMDRFRVLLTEILKEFGGADLRTFTRTGSTKTLWQEVGEIQKTRNAVIHKGETPDDCYAKLAISVAATLLNEIFPQVLRRLNLHMHDPCAICDQRHSITLPVTLTVPGPLLGTVLASAEIDLTELDLSNAPATISGKVTTYIHESDLAAMRSAPSETHMQVVSVLLRYQIDFECDSTKFVGTKMPWS